MGIYNEAIKEVKNWLLYCESIGIEPYHYDFKLLDNVNEDNNTLINEKNPIKRILQWKSDSRYTDGVEYNKLPINIYAVLLGKDTDFIKKNYGLDILCSFWTTYKKYLTKEFKLTLNTRNNGRVNVEMYNYLIRNYNKFKSVNDKFLGNSYLTHTIGNIGIWNKGFNTGRKNGDYLDIALLMIKNINDLEDSKNKVKTKFKDVIDTYYYNDFVDNNYEIKELFKNHLSGNELHPVNKDGSINKILYEEYLCNVSKLVEDRGKRLVKELYKKTS